MSLHRQLLCARIVATLFWLALAGPLMAVTLTFEGDDSHQVIDGIGVNVNYRSWEGTNLQPVLNAFIDQAGMTLFRVVYDLSDWEVVNDNADPNVMNWSYYNGIYGDADFDKLWDTLGYLNSRGITNGAFFCFMGWGPEWMMDPDVTANGVRTSLQPGMEAEWAETIASALIYARQNRGLKFNLVAPNNESDLDFEGIRIDDTGQYTNTLRKLADLLNANNVANLSFVAPDRSGGPLGYEFMPEMMADSVLMARVKHFGTHSYSDGDGKTPAAFDFINNSAYADRRLWLTEFNKWCYGCASGQLGDYSWGFTRGTAEHLIRHLANGASAAFVWEGYDSVYAHHFNSWSYWGLFGVDNINASTKTYTARKHFYTVAQVSKWVRPGARRIGIAGSQWPFSPMAAFKHETLGRTTIVGVNNGGTTRLDGTLDSLPGATVIDLYYTTASANLVFGGRTAVSNGSFGVNIPGDCVFTLVSASSMDTTPPLLAVESPTEGQLVGGASVIISGTATDNGRGGNGITSVTVGGMRATNDTVVGNGEAYWSRVVKLVSGTNRFVIIARDSQTNAVTNVLHVVADPTRPTVTISFPRNGSRVQTNTAMIFMTGTAADNRGVAAVHYQLNGGPWQLANGTTNWSAPIAMTAGTNRVRVFVEDIAGLRSLTNSTTFQFVVPSPLALIRIGNGTVSGATNGQPLEVGRNYLLTARPGVGFILTNWSTCVGEILTNRVTLSFRMTSNACLRAVFADVQRPTLTVAYPRSSARVLTNNGLVQLRGTARDNAGVTAVRYQLNNGPWTPAAGASNWTATALMNVGTNVLNVFAEDAAGHRSLTNRVVFRYVVTSPLTLETVGRGKVSGATNGQLLEVGRLYTLTAAPAAGFVLTNWRDCEDNDLGATSRAKYVVHISVDGLRPDAVTALGSNNLPNFHCLRLRGAFTDNARTDPDHTVTLPNHTCQLTGYGVAGPSGHNWTNNDVTTEDQTLAVNKGFYVPGVFDVVHDRGLRTGLFASKAKLSIFARSWNATNGAPDLVGADNGRNKIDISELNPDTTALVGSLITKMGAQPFNYVFLHYANTDNTGHSDGWNVAPGTPYSDAVRLMDTHLGALFAMIDGSVQLSNRVAIILTADHGGVDYDHGDVLVEANYTVPFYVWGPAVSPGVELYAINPSSRNNPGTARPGYSALLQPIRDGDAANLALRLLGMPSVPGSTINADQSLSATVPFASSAIVNGATLRFYMTSNACLRAVFADVQRPTLTITYPTSGARVMTNNGLVQLRGSARDNDGVTAVQYQLNNSPWTSATGTSNWTATALMNEGTNVLAVFAEDAAGNRSLTNRIVFRYVVTSRLTLEIMGNGTVTGAANGQFLEVGRTYLLTARAGAGFVFTNWTDCTDAVLTNRTTLSCRMQSNACLRVYFISLTAAQTDPYEIAAAVPPATVLVFDLNDTPPAVVAGQLHLRLIGPEEMPVVIEASPDLVNWTPVSTNTIAVGGLPLVMPLDAPSQFFRARRAE
jgi:O-glycosyl hydrolase